MVELSTVEKDIQQAYVKKIKYFDETQDLHTFDFLSDMNIN